MNSKASRSQKPGRNLLCTAAMRAMLPGYDEESGRFHLRFLPRPGIRLHGVRCAEEDFIFHKIERFRALRHLVEGRPAELRRESAAAARRKERLGVHVL